VRPALGCSVAFRGTLATRARVPVVAFRWSVSRGGWFGFEGAVKAVPRSDWAFGGQRAVGNRAFCCHLGEGAECGCYRALSDVFVMSGRNAEGCEVELELLLVQGAEVSNRECR
jgi:hypothetical protein